MIRAADLVCAGYSVVPDIRATHPEDHVLRDVRRMIGHAFQIARDQQRIQRLRR